MTYVKQAQLSEYLSQFSLEQLADIDANAKAVLAEQKKCRDHTGQLTAALQHAKAELAALKSHYNKQQAEPLRLLIALEQALGRFPIITEKDWGSWWNWPSIIGNQLLPLLNEQKKLQQALFSSADNWFRQCDKKRGEGLIKATYFLMLSVGHEIKIDDKKHYPLKQLGLTVLSADERQASVEQLLALKQLFIDGGLKVESKKVARVSLASPLVGTLFQAARKTTDGASDETYSPQVFEI